MDSSGDHDLKTGRMKVMMIAPDLGYGGAEKSFAGLSRLLAPHCDLSVIVFNKEIRQAYPIHGTFISLDAPTRQSLFGKWKSFRQRVERVRALKQQLAIEVSISFLEGADYVNYFSRRKERVIFSIRGSKRHDPKILGLLGRLRYGVLMPFCYRRANRIVCVSEGLRHEIASTFGVPLQRIMSISNYYDPAFLQSLAREPLDPLLAPVFEGSKTLIAVGRMSAEKGFVQLVDVFRRLKDIRKDVRLIMIGAGDFMQQVINRCQMHGLRVSKYDQAGSVDPTADVFFFGYQANPLKYVARSTLFVLPSLTEGFPNAMAEAMAIGTPTVAADCPYGPAELLGERKNGLLLPMLRTEDLHREEIYETWKHELNNLLDDAERRSQYASSARLRITDFGPNKVLNQWMETLSK